MNIQIIGKKKCQDTKKAERFFKERGVKFSRLDLNEKPLSPGEMRNILAKVAADDLVDRQSRVFREKFAYLDFEPAAELMEYPELMITPVVRCDGKVSVGYTPDLWKVWLEG